jgi:mevalonate kinase
LRAIAEAPSKVIITGEHFVVHGATALAAAVDKKVRVEVSHGQGVTIRSDRFGQDARAASLAPTVSVVKAMGKEFGFSPMLTINIRSSVPEGAGLGSSAATMVAVVAAVAKFEGLRLGAWDVVRLAMEGEKEIHGRPSGIDVNACALGGVITYRMGVRPRRLRFAGSRTFILVHSGKSRSTRRLINRVSRMKSLYPGLFKALSESATLVTRLAADRLVASDMATLGRLLTYNHAVLSTVGASNPDLDALVDKLLSMGCLGAKLTGAGGGGTVLAVPPNKGGGGVVRELAGRGYLAEEVSVPTGGVRAWAQ